jgi:two-component system, LytTR family, sensor histidine kinase AlgZ
MHPILADGRRLAIYLAAWLPLSGILITIFAFEGSLSWRALAIFTLPLDLGYAFVCLGTFYLCRAAPLHVSGIARVLGTQLGAALTSAALWVLVARGWFALLGSWGLALGAAPAFARLQPFLFGRGFLLFLIAALMHYLLVAFESSRRAETQSLEYRVLSREAELKALRAQLHPHFLFNSLNSVVALIGSDPDAARRTCVMLGDFLRSSLTLGARDSIPLGDEVALAQSLLAIEKVRFGSRLAFETRLEEAARACPVPPLLLQPLVENAVTHGIAHLLEGGAIRLEAVRRGDLLHVVVENPRDPEARASAGAGLGLDNVRRRLTAVYGNDARFKASAEGARFRVELSFPADLPRS